MEEKKLPDKFENPHYLFGGKCLDIGVKGLSGTILSSLIKS